MELVIVTGGGCSGDDDDDEDDEDTGVLGQVDEPYMNQDVASPQQPSGRRSPPAVCVPLTHSHSLACSWKTPRHLSKFTLLFLFFFLQKLITNFCLSSCLSQPAPLLIHFRRNFRCYLIFILPIIFYSCFNSLQEF